MTARLASRKSARTARPAPSPSSARRPRPSRKPRRTKSPIYEAILAELKTLDDETLNDEIWDFAEAQAECDNGGWNAYLCPHQCGPHSVPFSARCDNCGETIDKDEDKNVSTNGTIFCPDCTQKMERDALITSIIDYMGRWHRHEKVAKVIRSLGEDVIEVLESRADAGNQALYEAEYNL